MDKKKFIAMLKADDACQAAVLWAEKQKTLKDILKCSRGDWWVWLLKRHPEFTAKCNLRQLGKWQYELLINKVEGIHNE